MTEQLVEVARTDDIWNAPTILGAAERENFAEGERGVLIIEFPADWLAGVSGHIADLVQASGITLWKDTRTEGNKIYIYGVTSAPWVAFILAIIVVVLIAGVIISINKVVEIFGGSATLIAFGIVAAAIMLK